MKISVITGVGLAVVRYITHSTKRLYTMFNLYAALVVDSVTIVVRMPFLLALTLAEARGVPQNSTAIFGLICFFVGFVFQFIGTF